MIASDRDRYFPAKVCETEKKNGRMVPPALLKPGSTPRPIEADELLRTEARGYIHGGSEQQLHFEAG